MERAWCQDHAETLYNIAEPMACIAEIGNKKLTRIDWAREAYKEMTFGRGCNTVEEQMEWSLSRAIPLTFL